MPGDRDTGDDKQKENDDNEKGDGDKVEELRYEYYINYVEEQRLLDRWVKENMVKIDDEKVEDLLKTWKEVEAK